MASRVTREEVLGGGWKAKQTNFGWGQREIAEGRGNDASMGVESWKRTEARAVHGLSSSEIRLSYFDSRNFLDKGSMEIRYDSMVLRIRNISGRVNKSLFGSENGIRDEETCDRLI